MNNADLSHINDIIERNRICVIIPTYNNAGTVAGVIDGVLRYCRHVIVVNDGSTDDTLSCIARFGNDIKLISYEVNRGKGYALKQGFRKARELNFRYAITIDSDGQHFPEDIPAFVEATVKYPHSLIVGERGFEHDNMNGKSTFANKFSNFWFTVQTCRSLKDTQTGYRLYPLNRLPHLASSRYEAELELLVFSAWKGVKIKSIPIKVYYPPKEERVSHFRPGKDFFRISVLNTIMCFLAVVYGYPKMACLSIKRWFIGRLTKKKGIQRDVPLTFMRYARSLFTITFFVVAMMFFIMPGTFLYFLFGKRTEKKRMGFHRFVRWATEWVIYRVPGTHYRYNNKTGETFEKPAVIICNHQAHLDLMCVLMMSPRIVVLTNDWVWKNPLYGFILRYGEFYPVSDGLDANLERLSGLIKRGYSVVIFPEGTRSEDCSILRFHSGAFYLAEKLGVDVLPIFIHGIGHVLPKKDFMLREGSMYTEVEQRISLTEMTGENTLRKRTHRIHEYYTRHYEELRNELENAQYCVPYVKYKYKYKRGRSYSKCKALLKKYNNYSSVVDCDYSKYRQVVIKNSGLGILAWLMALVHRNIEIIALEQNCEMLDVALSCSNIPENLHFLPLSYMSKYDLNDSTVKYIELDEQAGVVNK